MEKGEMMNEDKVVGTTEQLEKRAGVLEAFKRQEAPKEPKQKNSNGSMGTMIVACLALLISFGGAGISLMNYYAIENLPAGGTSVNVPYYDGNNTVFEPTTVEGIAEKVAPSVVSIVTETRTSGMFGVPRSSSASGTGIIVTADGYIMTNKHVVAGSTKVTIVRDNGDMFDNVKVIGVDPLNDVAFVKVDGVSGWPAAELGDSKTLKVGQPVMAIGNALGQFQNTITQGVVSGLGRSITASDSAGGNVENLTDMIQTDASINPGNSGGPLVNAAGQVIGMNTAVSTDANGIGFAIPISTTKGLLRNLISVGRVERPYIGVYYATITPDVAKEYDLPVKNGAYVHNDNGSAIMSGSPAEKAGVKDGDIIIKIGGVEVGKLGSVTALISEHAVGEKIEVVVLRDGVEKTLSMMLEAYPVK